MTATELLKKDHSEVKKLFTQLGRTTTRAARRREGLIDKLAEELEIHAQVEEEIFYPAMKESGEGEDLVQEALDEHGEMKRLMAELQGMDVSSDDVAAKAEELREAVVHHATEEEREMFPLARKRLGTEELSRLGEQIQSRKAELKGSPVQRAKHTIKKGIRKIA
ncbi:MAG TPA: hemerythrin domain-containing protein [Methylomirabilota bacterium]|jgi:hemerythrin-like domain-containing protein|nr:hemerythrin domain-containing protein [Methylomirabilota bacterium]